MKVLFLIFATLISIGLATGAARPKFNPEENVLTLNNHNYGTAIDYYEHSLILFYAPNASNFNKTTTEFFKAAEQASTIFPGISFCRMDLNAFPDYAKMVGATKLPAIKLFDQGEDTHRNFTGKWTADSILQWLRTETEKAIAVIDDGEEIEDFVKGTDNVGLYLGSYKSEAYSAFLSLSTVFSDIVFIRSENEDLKPDEDVGNDIFVLYRSFNTEASKFRGKFEFNALKNFTIKHKYQSVMALDSTAFNRIFTMKETAAILIRNHTGEEHLEAHKQFQVLGPSLRDKIALAIGTYQNSRGVANHFGLTQADLPAVIILDYDNKMTKYKLDRKITTKNTKIFLQNFFLDNLMPHYKSAPIPEPDEAYEGNVKITVAQTFQKTVSEPDKHVLIEIYSPSCGLCMKFAPIYTEFADTVSQIEDLVVAKLDGSVNDAPGIAVEYFPMVFLYPKGAKDSPIEYQGERTEEGLLEFIQQHVTLSILD